MHASWKQAKQKFEDFFYPTQCIYIEALVSDNVTKSSNILLHTPMSR